VVLVEKMSLHFAREGVRDYIAHMKKYTYSLDQSQRCWHTTAGWVIGGSV